MSERLLKPREVAEQLRVSVPTTYRLIDSGRIAALRVGRQLRVPESALDALREEPAGTREER